ncbi:MAG: hypothetical protein B6I36_03105 [Desulfobacteraceae bacterium 4572_35.1]|nr:MAG: hypothetical protein B6I36_03105 [Desulfobacteraceae bacterium 4572_35.1]
MEPVKIERTDATLSIDGAVIKQIREQQLLTQLYVAKMVGVTTDTISRWENKRYPTIKRINAQRLAEALEVELEQIVCADTAGRKSQQFENKFSVKLWLGLVVIAVFIAGGLWLLIPANIIAERVLPSYAAPGATIPVHISLVGAGARGVVRETLPDGCTLVSAVPEPSSFDKEKRLIRWIVQIGEKPFDIYYVAKVKQRVVLNSMLRFDGVMVARTATGSDHVELIGANQLVLAHIHWADLNGDSIIDDDEMLEASCLGENMVGLPLDMDSVEDLWIEEYYHWSDQMGNFVPGKASVQGEDFAAVIK